MATFDDVMNAITNRDASAETAKAAFLEMETDYKKAAEIFHGKLDLSGGMQGIIKRLLPKLLNRWTGALGLTGFGGMLGAGGITGEGGFSIFELLKNIPLIGGMIPF